MARLLSLLLMAAVLAACALVLVFDRRRGMQSETEKILARNRYLLVRADAIPGPGSRSIVRMDSFRDLVRLAKLHDELIVSAGPPGEECFALPVDGVMYLYEPGSPGPTARDISLTAA